jgi:hypothetical protein
LKRALIIIVVLFILIQFIRIEKNNALFVAENDFLALTKAPEEIKTMVKSACYDCHSNTTHYPWYSEIAPVSWFIEHHIKEAKHHLNFSEWSSYSLKKANHKLEECYEELERHKMPTSGYALMHKEARLSNEQIITLAQWFKNQMR